MSTGNGCSIFEEAPSAMDLAIESNHLAQGIFTPELTGKIFYASQEKRDRG